MKWKITNEDCPKYPCLMIDNNSGAIVLFISSGEGMIVAYDGLAIEPRNIGQFRAFWNMDDFEIFKGSITLTN